MDRKKGGVTLNNTESEAQQYLYSSKVSPHPFIDYFIVRKDTGMK